MNRIVVSIVLTVGILSLLLTGCNNEDKKHHEEVMKNAEAYFENKYGERRRSMITMRLEIPVLLAGISVPDRGR